MIKKSAFIYVKVESKNNFWKGEKKKQPLQKKRAKKRYLKTVSVPQKLTINKEKLYNRALNEFIYL